MGSKLHGNVSVINTWRTWPTCSGSRRIHTLHPGGQGTSTVIDGTLVNINTGEPIPTVPWGTGTTGEGPREVDTRDWRGDGAGRLARRTFIDISGTSRVRARVSPALVTDTCVFWLKNKMYDYKKVTIFGLREEVLVDCNCDGQIWTYCEFPISNLSVYI